jgi:hypothetical protein
MTHDELLAICDNYSFKDSAEPVKVLRAVVELHKPKEEDGKLWCSHEVCYNHVEFLERNDCDCSYPCPTIEAIEEQLK